MVKAVTWARLKEVLSYNPRTGVFVWNDFPGRRGVSAGTIAGCIRKDRYILIGIDKCLYLAHRLAWFYMKEVWPPKGLDHDDRDPSNNRIKNLRPATQSQNMQNRLEAQKNNGSGLLGAYRYRNGWKSSIQLRSKVYHLGVFPSALAAHKAFVKAKRKLHPFSRI